MRNLAVTAAFLLTISSAILAQNFKGPPWFSAAKCTRRASDAADKALDELSSWAAIYRTFRLYKQCDDGALAEGYSDKVVILLTQRWPTVEALSKLAQSNPQFGDFVLHHVDGLMSPNEAKTIANNAEKHCPVGSNEMCQRLAAKARNPQ